MATDVVDDHEMREAQRDYLDFLDDDVSMIFLIVKHLRGRQEKPCGRNKSDALESFNKIIAYPPTL